jgi:hypothetical protein
MESAEVLSELNDNEIRAIIGEFYDYQELERFRKEKERGLTRSLDSECKAKVDEIDRAVTVGGQIANLEALNRFVPDRQQQLTVLKTLEKRNVEVNYKQIWNDIAAEYANSIMQLIEEQQAITEKGFLKIVPADGNLRQIVYDTLPIQAKDLEPIKRAIAISEQADAIIEEIAKDAQTRGTLQPDSFCEIFDSINPDWYNFVLEELRTRPGLDRVCKKTIENSINILKAVNALIPHYEEVEVKRGKSASQQLRRVKAIKIYDLDDLHLDLCPYVLSRLKNAIHNNFPSYNFKQEAREVNVANEAFKVLKAQGPAKRAEAFAAVDHDLQEEVRTLLGNKYKISL